MVGIHRIVGRPDRRPQPSAFPLLPLVAALLILLAFAQGGLWLWQSISANPDMAENPFKELGNRHPVTVKQRKGDVEPRRVVLPVQASNLQMGDANAAVVAVILSDPSCGQCRKKVSTWVNQLPTGTKAVYKFWPREPLRMTPGLLVELARREGVAQKYWTLIEEAEGDLNDEALLRLLEKAGVSLEKQRAALSEPELKVGQTLEKDLQLARNLEMPPPPVMTLNGYVIDNRALNEDKISVYAERLTNNEPLTQDSDYWLMEKK